MKEFNAVEQIATLISESYIDSGDCQEGVVYYVDARRIWSASICMGTTENGVAFRGIREKMGSYFLFDEYHYDDNEFFGTVKPLFALTKAPSLDSDDQLMDWLLDQEITITKEKINWYESMPVRYKNSSEFKFFVEEENQSLANLLRLQEEGLANQEPWTFKSILNKNRTV
jgi:hypothetical protein